MSTNMNIIEYWWHNIGIADRIQASGIFCYDDVQYFFQKTDDWWGTLTDDEKREVYDEFEVSGELFDEN